MSERGNLELLTKLTTNLEEDFLFLKNLLFEKKDSLFLGVRDGYFNIYYMGGSVGKIYSPKNANKLKVEVHRKYLNNKYVTSKSDYQKISFELFKEKYSEIMENVKKIAMGDILETVIDEEDKDGEKRSAKVTEEKILQQWIINENNRNDSEWYYLDMEYTMSNAPGRFDMIAIRRIPDSAGKHRVALIELKVRSDRYGGFGSKQYDDKEKHTKYVEVETKGNLFDYPNLKYGSGLLGHMADYLRYLHKDFYNNGDGNNSALIKEISQILEWHKEFGILPECLHNVSSKDLALKPEIIFVSYTDVPSLNGKCEYEDVMSMKKTFYKYMYKSPIDGEKTSKYSVERMLTKDNVKGLMAVRDTFCSEHPQIEFKLEINEKLYDFRFVFVDTRESDKNVWECI